ncbi:MAG: hypothetical protein K8J31_08110, partial [Anaerolineae bacterium]|nr:hypothetical protein [Anaerolineae bacterium]
TGRVLDTVGANGLSVRSSPNGDVVATLPVGETFDVIDGPACWQIQTFAPADQYEFRVWRIRNRRNNLEGWVEEYGRRNAGSPFYYYQVLTDSDTNGQQAVINAFSADPAAVEYRGTVTLSWSVSDAARVRIQVVRFNGQFGQTLDNLPLEGRFSYTLPEESTQSAQFQLSAEDAQGRQLAVETLTVPVRCGFSDTYNGCPLTQLTTQAAYQTFQGGLMLWRGDMQQIFVLYNGGTYQIYDDTWTPDQPVDSGETPPSGLILPARGFGKVWANQPGVRDRLGWASGNEASYTAKVETYLIPRDEKAIFINTPDGRVLIIGQVWRTQ